MRIKAVRLTVLSVVVVAACGGGLTAVDAGDRYYNIIAADLIDDGRSKTAIVNVFSQADEPSCLDELGVNLFALNVRSRNSTLDEAARSLAFAVATCRNIDVEVYADAYADAYDGIRNISAPAWETLILEMIEAADG